MSDPGAFARLRGNWAAALGRIRLARSRQPPVDWARVALTVAGGLALVVFVAVLYDARVIAWTRTVPLPVRAGFEWITRFGQSGWLLIPTGLVALVVALGDWRRVSRVNAAAWWEIGTFAAVLFVVVAASGIATDIIKPIVGRFRPDFVPGGGAFAFAPLAFGGYANYSFPSGHATTMAAVAIMAAFVPGVVTAPIVIAAGLVAISRVMIDVHFPSDVVGGSLVGVGVGLVILRLMTLAGIGFVVRPDGRIHRRLGVLSRLRRRRDGYEGLFPALWIALSPRRGGRKPPPDPQ